MNLHFQKYSKIIQIIQNQQNLFNKMNESSKKFSAHYFISSLCISNHLCSNLVFLINQQPLISTLFNYYNQQYFMADKPKFLFTPSSPQYQTNALRTSFQAMSYNNLHQNNNVANTNGSVNMQNKVTLTHEHPMNKQKNFSVNIKQLEGQISKIQNVCSQIKKQEANHGTSKYQSDINQLRNSLSTTNQIKRPDLEFLRKTAINTPKGFNFFSQKLNNQSTESTQVNSQQTQMKSPSSHNQYNHINNIFTKKSVESSQPIQPIHSPNMEVVNKPKFPGKNSYFQKGNGTHRQQRKSLTKKSVITCGFYIGKCLGNGKFGEVYIAKHVNSGFVCALKKIVKAKVLEYNMLNQLIQQIKIQCFLQHPNIVQFYGVTSDEQHIYIIMEYMEGGTLFDYLSNKQILQQSEAVVFLRQICQAVKFMHDKNILHRDIKPENIVMSYNLAKLCDFGWAARISGTRKTVCGTSDYFSPELVQRKQYDQSIDVWCLGILTYQLLTGRVPFEHKERKVMMQKILNVDKDKVIYPQSMSEVAKDFIQNLIKKNPNQRLKSYKLLEHPFLYIKKKQDEKY